MIYLEKNSVNQVVLELTSVSSLLSPYYLFEFTKTDSNNPPLYTCYFTATDLSNFKSRYNRFQITDSGSTNVNLTGGTIDLLPGSYNYNVYEATVPTLLVSATTQSIISTGKAFVNGTDTEILSIYR